MQKTDEQKNAEKQSQKNQSQEQEAQELQPRQQPVQAADMQQVGGDTARKKPIEARMVVPLQKLDQVRDTDAPAVIFQRLQTRQSGTTQPLEPTGKNW